MAMEVVGVLEHDSHSDTVLVDQIVFTLCGSVQLPQGYQNTSQ